MTGYLQGISMLVRNTKSVLSFHFFVVGLVPMIGFCAPAPWRITLF
jgi:hypothetical protein